MKGPQLGEGDKRAVDMLLDNLPSASTAASAFHATHNGIVEPELLNATRRLLSRLDAYEVGDPPADLVSRTMARIHATPGQAPLEQTETSISANARGAGI